MISIIHLRFRRAKRESDVATSFRSLGYPVTNWLSLAFVALIIWVTYETPGMRLSAVLIPVWLVVLGIG